MNRRIFDLCKEIAAVNSGSINKAIDDARAKMRHSKSGSDFYCYPKRAFLRVNFHYGKIHRSQLVPNIGGEMEIIMKYFISHSSKDQEWASELLSVLSEISTPRFEGKPEFFFSSNPDTGSDVDKKLLPNIDLGLAESGVIILLITENFLRSSYCIYELSLASFLERQGKRVVLVVQNENQYERIKSLFPDKVYVDASSPNGAATFLKPICTTVNESDKVRMNNFLRLMSDSVLQGSVPFFGMDFIEHRDSYSFIENNCIEKMTFGYPSDRDTMKKHLRNAEEMIFVATTGSGFLKTYRKEITEAVSSGTRLSVVIADRDSQFCSDIGEIEVFGARNDVGNKKRIAGEFLSSIQYLNEIYNEAIVLSDGGKDVDVSCYCSYTLIRQTAFIIRKRNGDSWGWITCTMPPERSADRTPSIVFKGAPTRDGFSSAVWKYCSTLTEYAKKRGGVIRIDGTTQPNGFVNSTGEISKDVFNKSEAYWKEKRASALSNMSEKAQIYDAVLIEVAAQHPLIKKSEPGAEFKARLDKAVELYYKLTDSGVEVKIYVPDSLHKHNGVTDMVSLSSAGCNYLAKRGIPLEDLLGDDSNLSYKGEDGVYNSSDECFVASKLFLDGEFGNLICICSPYQVMRKSFFYLEFGCVPRCYAVTADTMHHSNFVAEIFDSLNSVLYFDHSWQDKSSTIYKFFREERKP